MELTFVGNGLVWNPKTGKALCKFVGGKYTTGDAKEIKALRDLEYKAVDGFESYDAEQEPKVKAPVKRTVKKK